MSLLTIFLTVLVFTLLTVVYLKGRRVVENSAPESLGSGHLFFVFQQQGRYYLFRGSRRYSIFSYDCRDTDTKTLK